MLAAVAACDEPTTSPEESARGGAVVLNGTYQVGLTLVPHIGATSTHIDFGALFDGATFTLERDTVITTSSKGAGDLLYIADLARAEFRSIQLPSGSNPAG